MELIRQFILYIRKEKFDDCISGQMRFLQSNFTTSSKYFTKEAIISAFNSSLNALENGADTTEHIIDYDPHFQIKEEEEQGLLYGLLLTQQVSLSSCLGQFFSNVQELYKALEIIQKFYAASCINLLKKHILSFGEGRTEALESEERYKDLFDNAHDLIHIVKPNGNIMYVNAAWRQTMGGSEREIKGRSIYSFVHQQDYNKFITYRENILKGNKTEEDITLRLISKDNKPVHVEGFISAKFKDGLPIYTRGIFRDISTRLENEKILKETNSQLVEREENLQQLIHHAPDAIIVIDAESMITLWNPKAEQVFGWKQEEVVNKALADIIIPPSYRKGHSEGMRRYLATGEAHVLNKTIEVTALNKSGGEFDISLTISHFKTTDKNFFISFIRDIHQQKQNEKELQLKRKEVEESNKELEQYTWLASHDLREPLRKILTYSDLILTRHEEALSEDIQLYISKIHTSARRMGSLIKSLLLYSSISQENYLYTKISLSTVVQEVLGDLELLISETGARIHCDLLPDIEAIPHQISQLFQNLISNALKYVHKGNTPEIMISAEEQNNSVHLSISDNGIGFTNSDEAKIFELFQRLQGDVSKEGLGIGLALCKKIVQNHKGIIAVESSLNKGTTFTIVLPVKHN